MGLGGSFSKIYCLFFMKFLYNVFNWSTSWTCLMRFYYGASCRGTLLPKNCPRKISWEIFGVFVSWRLMIFNYILPLCAHMFCFSLTLSFGSLPWSSSNFWISASDQDHRWWDILSLCKFFSESKSTTLRLIYLRIGWNAFDSSLILLFLNYMQKFIAFWLFLHI